MEEILRDMSKIRGITEWTDPQTGRVVRKPEDPAMAEMVSGGLNPRMVDRPAKEHRAARLTPKQAKQ